MKKENHARITQKLVAERLGLHVTSVSKALLGDTSISVKTRKKILKTVKEMGYVPDPALQALVVYRGNQKPPAFRSVLGWIYPYAEKIDMRRFQGYDDLFRAASARALALGYRLEPFYISSAEDSRRLSKVLRSRGIEGIVIAPHAESRTKLNLLWNDFSAVSIGHTLESPLLHRVTNDHFKTISRLIHLLIERGYRRIGSCIRREDRERMEGRMESAIHYLQNDRAQLFDLTERMNEKEFQSWFFRIRPDVLIIGSEDFIPFLKGLRVKIPQDLGLVHYSRSKTGERISGMYQNYESIGRHSIDLLVSMMNRHEKGIPEDPIRLMVDGIWCEGITLKRE